MSDDPSVIPTENPVSPEATRSRKGQLIVNTGDGKGKSTAAFGVMLRSLARGWDVAVIQFLKSGDWKVGEEKMGRELGVHWWAIGEGFTWNSDDLTEDEAVAQAAWAHAAEVIAAGDHQLVIIDELGRGEQLASMNIDREITVCSNTVVVMLQERASSKV